MLVKVCGLTEQSNVSAVETLGVDCIGMIFHEPSSRFINENTFDTTKAKKVGVFVNKTVSYIKEAIAKHNLSVVQLHGNETVKFVEELKAETVVEIWKVFSIHDKNDLLKTKDYEAVCDAFLFDTKGKLPGGNGSVFNWQLLNHYKGNTPFWLSGGIQPHHVSEIVQTKQNHKNLCGVDLNSGFEISPGIKNNTLLQSFLEELHEELNT